VPEVFEFATKVLNRNPCGSLALAGREFLMRSLAVLPLDDRPCTYDIPARVGAIAGARVLLPPRELLGNLTQQADRQALGAWLLDVAPRVDAVVVALDTLAYGGLIPSRRSTDGFSELVQCLQPILQLKQAHPHLPIHAFSVTMRLSDSDVNEEEKSYWDRYGKMIYRYSFYQHRHKTTADEADRAIAAEARRQIPDAILDDYLQTRERNFSLNQTMVKWAGSGLFTSLMLTQDDTSSFGFNVEEQQQLQQMVTTTRLEDRVFIYPGADEVAAVLVARAINHLNQRTPTIAVSWHPLDGKRIQAMYEDRPLWQTLRGQIRAAGCKEIGDEAAADALIVVNTPASAQGDLALRLNLDAPDTPLRNFEPLLLTLEMALGAGKMVGLADVAYANGADPRLMPELVQRVDIWRLKAFAAWNTAGNTFGTLVAALSCATHSQAQDDANTTLLAERLAEDWLYQSVLRPELQALSKQGRGIGELADTLQAALAAEWATHFGDRPFHFSTHFPWQRLFEAAVYTSSSSDSSDVSGISDSNDCISSRYCS
jgi:hypothetical protein